MTEPIEIQIQNIRKRIEQAQKEHIRAEHVYETAKEAADKARERLKTQFNVETVDAAKSMLMKLETDLKSSVDAITIALNDLER